MFSLEMRSFAASRYSLSVVFAFLTSADMHFSSSTVFLESRQSGSAAAAVAAKPKIDTTAIRCLFILPFLVWVTSTLELVPINADIDEAEHVAH